MVTLSILIAAFAVLAIAGRLGLRAVSDPIAALRGALAVMFLFAAGSHFGPPRADLIAMVPPALPAPGLWVTLTGLAEAAGAVGLLVPRLAPAAGTALALLLVAMFPANVHAAREGLAIADRPAMDLLPRALLQALYVTAALVAAWGPRRTVARRGEAAPSARAGAR